MSKKKLVLSKKKFMENMLRILFTLAVLVFFVGCILLVSNYPWTFFVILGIIFVGVLIGHSLEEIEIDDETKET